MRIVIEIEGGCLRRIRSDEPVEAEVVLVDWDNLETGEPIEEVAEVLAADQEGVDEARFPHTLF